MARRPSKHGAAPKSREPKVDRYVAETGFAVGRPYKLPGKPPGKAPPRGAHAFEACKDGALIIYVTPPTGAEHWWDGVPIRIEARQVGAVLAACGDALARKPTTR